MKTYQKLSITIFVLMLLAVCSQVYAQQRTSIGGKTELNTRTGGFKADSVLVLPGDAAVFPWFDSCGRIWMKDGTVYYNDCSSRVKMLSMKDTAYIKTLVPTTANVDSGLFATVVRLKDTAAAIRADAATSIDTTSLSNRINQRVKYADTTAMLAPYLHKADTAAMLAPYLRNILLAVPGALFGAVNFTISGQTASGTLALNSQSANTMLAAPDGSSGTPSFRALTGNDIPSLPYSKLTTGFPSLTINGATYDISASRTWNVGTVTSVAAGWGLQSGTITTSGTLVVDSNKVPTTLDTNVYLLTKYQAANLYPQGQTWTANSIPYATGGFNSLTQDNANFIWYPASHYLGIDMGAGILPTAPIHVRGYNVGSSYQTGILIEDTTIATNAVPQGSMGLEFVGRAYATSPTSGRPNNQLIGAGIRLFAASGSTNPTPYLDFNTRVDNVAYPATIPMMRLDGNGNLGLGVSTPIARLQVVGLSLTGSSSNGIFNATQSWSTTGVVTGFKMNITTTTSGYSDGSMLMDIQVSGASKFSIDPTGNTSIINLLSNSSSGNIAMGIKNQSGALTTANLDGISVFADRAGTNQYVFATTTGQTNAFALYPKYNQTSGTAANTDLLINRVQTAIGSGTQNLMDLQVGSSSKFSVDNSGDATLAGNLTFSAAGTTIVGKSGTNGNRGNATFSSGVATITNTAVTANTIVVVGCITTHSGTEGVRFKQVVTAASGFTITSINADGTTATGDNSTFSWFIIN